MANRDLSLSARAENTREPLPEKDPIQFKLSEIKQHFDENLSSIKNQFNIADELFKSGKNEECKNIWRSQIVFLEGILDFYLHEISKYSLYNMFTGNWKKSIKYKTIKVPMEQVEIGLKSSESKEWFFTFLNKQFERDVFLAAETMVDQLNLIGLDFGDVMKIAFPRDTSNASHKYGKKVVSELFSRRNQIAHQLDRDHKTAIQKDIDKAYVETKIEEVTKIVNAIQSLAEEKNNT